MRIILALLVLSLTWTTLGQTCPAQSSDRMNHIISAQGDKLYEGDEEFRFISFNIPNLQLVEDNFAPRVRQPVSVA